MFGLGAAAAAGGKQKAGARGVAGSEGGGAPGYHLGGRGETA